MDTNETNVVEETLEQKMRKSMRTVHWRWGMFGASLTMSILHMVLGLYLLASLWMIFCVWDFFLGRAVTNNFIAKYAKEEVKE